MSSTIFYRKGKSPEEIEREQLLRRVHHGPRRQLAFLLELIQLSELLRENPKNNRNMSLFQEEVMAFFKALQQAEVQYLLIGGFAVNAHGYSRSTGDLDLWVQDTAENRERLVQAALAIGVPGAEALRSMEWVPGWTGFRLSGGFEIEIMSYIAGFSQDDFTDCRRRSRIIEIKNTTIPLLNLNDLIEAKSHLSRPKDQEDLRQLKQIRELREEEGRNR